MPAWLPFAALVLVLGFGVAGLTGAPYVPILKKDRRKLVDLTDMHPGQTLLDLGSGDGQLLREAARRGLHAIGYEINPVMVVISWLACWKYRRLIRIHWANIWTTTLPPADIIYVFLIDRFMDKLESKLESEVTTPTTVVLYVFKFHHRKPIRQNATTSIYRFGEN